MSWHLGLSLLPSFPPALHFLSFTSRRAIFLPKPSSQVLWEPAPAARLPLHEHREPSSPIPTRAPDLLGNPILNSCQQEPDPSSASFQTAGWITQVTQRATGMQMINVSKKTAYKLSTVTECKGFLVKNRAALKHIPLPYFHQYIYTF